MIRSLEELERYGFLKREKRGRNNTYHLTPAYVQPARPDDITLTGGLTVENAPPAKPVKRKTLHNRRPDPTLPLAVEQVAPEQPIPISRGTRGSKRVAPVQPISPVVNHETGCTDAPYFEDSAVELVASEQPGLVAPVLPNALDRLHQSNLDITNNQILIDNQQQQEAAADENTTTKAEVELILINAFVAPDEAVRWASDLIGLAPNDIRDALSIMRAKPAYLRREIARPGAYMRTLCKTAVINERELAEHEARGSRTAEIRRAEERSALTKGAKPPETGAHDASTGFTRATNADDLPAHDDNPPRGRTNAGGHHVGTEANVLAQAIAQPDDTPSIQSLVDDLESDQREAVTKAAWQIVRGGPDSPAWAAALSMAMRRLGYVQ